MKGWIKLYRQSINNPVWKHDLTAWHIFEGLLILADKNGAWSGGRFQLATALSINPNTLYKALKRLENAKMVTLSSNNRFTTIRICNWTKYQAVGNRLGNTSSNNQVTTGEHSYKNKELRIKKGIKKSSKGYKQFLASKEQLKRTKRMV